MSTLLPDGLRGMLADSVTGNVPDRFWPDPSAPIFYERCFNGVVGPSGVGKSTILQKVLADVSATRKVIYCGAEDDDIMNRYKLEAAGAKLENILLASYLLPRDLDALSYAIRTLDARVVCFDTMAKHIVGPSGRSLPPQQWDIPLQMLTAILAGTDCAAIGVHHTNKNVSAKADWRAAISGSTQGFTGTARAISLVGIRPDDTSQIVLCPVKDQYHETPPAIAFSRETESFTQPSGEDIDIGYVRVAEKNILVTNPTALVAIQGEGNGRKGPDPVALAEAAKFLTQLLANGAHIVGDCVRCIADPDAKANPLCGHSSHKAAKNGCPGCGGPVADVAGLKFKAEAAGVSGASIKRARAELGIVASRKGAKEASVTYIRLPKAGDPGPDGTPLTSDHPALVPGAPTTIA